MSKWKRFTFYGWESATHPLDSRNVNRSRLEKHLAEPRGRVNQRDGGVRHGIQDTLLVERPPARFVILTDQKPTGIKRLHTIRGFFESADQSALAVSNLCHADLESQPPHPVKSRFAA